jgi:hypothetical protein
MFYRLILLHVKFQIICIAEISYYYNLLIILLETLNTELHLEEDNINVILYALLQVYLYNSEYS